MSTTNKDEISIKELVLKFNDWIKYFLSKWQILLVAGVLGGVLGFTYAYFQKPLYTATLTFALEDDKGSSGGGLSGIASQFGFDLGSSAGGAFSGANLIELMKSRTLVEKVLLDSVTVQNKRMLLIDYYINYTDLRKRWQEKPRLKNIAFGQMGEQNSDSFLQDSVLGTIYKQIEKEILSVSQIDKKVSIISIEVKSGNELFSKLFTEGLARVVSDFYVDTKSKKAKNNVEILERQVDSIRAELNNAISGVASANDDIYNLNPALNIKRVPSSKRQIDVQANTAILTQLVTNLELARVTLRRETPLIQIIDRPILPLEKVKLSKLKTMLSIGFVCGFIALLWFLCKRLWHNIMQEEFSN